MTLASVPVRYVQFLLAQAEAAGCDTSDLLQSIGLNPKALEQMGHCSAFTYGQLYQRIMLEVRDEWFAMFSLGKVPLGSFRLMCLVVSQCHDLRQALIRGGEFAEICRGVGVRTIVDVKDGLAHLRLAGLRNADAEEFNRLQDTSNPNFIMLSLLASHRFHCWLTGADLRIRLVKFSFSRERIIFNVDDFCADEVMFDCLSNELVYDEQILDLPIVQNQEAALEFARTAPYHLVTLDPSNIALSEKVRTVLNRDVGHSMPSAEEVASLFHMSATTLRRHLMAENTSYQTLKDECRLEAALHYLSCPELTNTMVAEKLGFDEPSAFFRSFKKWTGETPGNYRTRLLGAPLSTPSRLS